MDDTTAFETIAMMSAQIDPANNQSRSALMALRDLANRQAAHPRISPNVAKLRQAIAQHEARVTEARRLLREISQHPNARLNVAAREFGKPTIRKMVEDFLAQEGEGEELP
jgi:hypothetical protein